MCLSTAGRVRELTYLWTASLVSKIKNAEFLINKGTGTFSVLSWVTNHTKRAQGLVLGCAVCFHLGPKHCSLQCSLPWKIEPLQFNSIFVIAPAHNIPLNLFYGCWSILMHYCSFGVVIVLMEVYGGRILEGESHWDKFGLFSASWCGEKSLTHPDT